MPQCCVVLHGAPEVPTTPSLRVGHSWSKHVFLHGLMIRIQTKGNLAKIVLAAALIFPLKKKIVSLPHTPYLPTYPVPMPVLPLTVIPGMPAYQPDKCQKYTVTLGIDTFVDCLMVIHSFVTKRV